MGLRDTVVNINTTVGVSTIVPIGISGLLYIFMMITLVICPQSPYQNSLSGLIWYVTQKFGGWKYKDQGSDEALRSVSPKITWRQMRLAIEETEKRKRREEQNLMACRQSGRGRRNGVVGDGNSRFIQYRMG